MDLPDLTPDEVTHAHELARRYVGKPLEAITPADLDTIRTWIAVEVVLLREQQRVAVEAIAGVLPTLDVEQVVRALDEG